jgi:hypothetical protein
LNLFFKKVAVVKTNIAFLLLIIYFLLPAFHFSLLYAQAPDTLWTRIYGGVDNDFANCVQQTADSGYIIVGYTYSFGGGFGYSDVYLIKADSLGDTLWTRTYGGPSHDTGESVQQTTDGGFIVTGATRDPIGTDVYTYLLKTDFSGDTVWTRTYSWGNDTHGYSVQQTSDAGYIICGGASFEVCFFKTDSLGNIAWGRTYGGDGFEEGSSFQMETDGEYVITGFTTSFGAGGADVYLIKTAPWGDTLWTKTYGGNQDEWGNSVQVTADGGYVITGSTNSFGLDYQVLLIRTDAIGDTMWVRTYGGPGFEAGQSILVTTDGAFVIVGTTDSFGAGSRDIYLIKTDSLGNLLWATTFGGTEDDVGVSIQETFDGGYIVAGYTRSFGAGSYDLWLLKIEPELGVKEDNTVVKNNIIGTTIFSGPLLLPEGKRCKIFDITGRVVIPDKIRLGIYFIEVDGQITRKVIKVR